VIADLRREFGESVLQGLPSEYLTDFTRAPGRADAVVLPRTAEEVAAVLAWCYEREVPIVPRGGGTGAAAGAVPDGGVVLALDRLDRVRSFDPELWRIHVEAGVPTGRLKQLVRESGLMFAPDPGAPEQSQIGGNIATNAGERRNHLPALGDECASPVRFARRARVSAGDAAQQAVRGINRGRAVCGA